MDGKQYKKEHNILKEHVEKLKEMSATEQTRRQGLFKFKDSPSFKTRQNQLVINGITSPEPISPENTGKRQITVEDQEESSINKTEKEDLLETDEYGLVYCDFCRRQGHVMAFVSEHDLQTHMRKMHGANTTS